MKVMFLIEKKTIWNEIFSDNYCGLESPMLLIRLWRGWFFLLLLKNNLSCVNKNNATFNYRSYETAGSSQCSNNAAAMPCFIGYHYCTTSSNKAWTQVLHKFKCYLRRAACWRFEMVTMIPAGNKAKRLSSVDHTTKTIHHHALSRSDEKYSDV